MSDQNKNTGGMETKEGNAPKGHVVKANPDKGLMPPQQRQQAREDKKFPPSSMETK